MIQTRVTGLGELKAKFAQIPSDVSKKVLRRMGSAGTKVFKPAIIGATPRRTGRAQSAVIVKFAREKSNEQQATYIVTYRMGKRQQQIKRGKQVQNLDAWYITLVERGHRKRVGKKRGKALRQAGGGMVAGRFFFAKALVGAQRKALTAMVDAGNAEIKKLL